MKLTFCVVFAAAMGLAGCGSLGDLTAEEQAYNQCVPFWNGVRTAEAGKSYKDLVIAQIGERNPTHYAMAAGWGHQFVACKISSGATKGEAERQVLDFCRKDSDLFDCELFASGLDLTSWANSHNQ